MFRKILRPRLWWLLALPLAFYLTRGVAVRNNVGTLKVLSVGEYDARKRVYSFVSRKAFGQYYDDNPYQVWQFVANACLVIGCLSVGKELFLNKPKVPTA